MSEVSRVTSAIPPLSTIQDTGTRRVLEALVNGWRTRNGDLKPDSDERFITKGELTNMVTDINNGYFTKGPGRNLLVSGVDQGYVDAVALLRALERSPLWTELGQRIDLIDLSIIDEQKARIDAVQAVADGLADEAEARLKFEDVTGSAIKSINETNDTQATLITGLTTRVGDAETTIIDLQTTTQGQATSLEKLTTRVGDTESSITDLKTTTSDTATSLESLTTRVGDTEASISPLQTTTANQADSLELLGVSVGDLTTAISDEKTARANADNAMAKDVETQFAAVGESLSAIQTTAETAAPNVSALADVVEDVQTTLDETTAAVETETKARIDANKDIYAKYSVKIDLNGYLTGFGLMSTANDGETTSDFIVRSDRFSIVNPSGNKATLIMTNNTINVYDENGNPRVRIGKL